MVDPMYDIYMQFITTVGFPAGAFLLMYKLATDTVVKNTEAIVKLTEAIIRLNSRNNGNIDGHRNSDDR